MIVNFIASIDLKVTLLLRVNTQSGVVLENAFAIKTLKTVQFATKQRKQTINTNKIVYESLIFEKKGNEKKIKSLTIYVRKQSKNKIK